MLFHLSEIGLRVISLVFTKKKNVRRGLMGPLYEETEPEVLAFKIIHDAQYSSSCRHLLTKDVVILKTEQPTGEKWEA